jgi:hypothetical protein
MLALLWEEDFINRVILLGGNQGKLGDGSVNYCAFGTSKIVAYTLPKDYDPIDFNLPFYDASSEEGTYDNTR